MPFACANTSFQSRDWRCPTCRLAARARDGMLAIPNNPLVVAAVQAICAAGANTHTSEGGWRRSRDGYPYYEFWSGSGGRVRVTLENEPEAAWADVESFTNLSLDVALSMLAALVSDSFRASACAPRREPIWLGAPAVLAAKGYGRFGEERRQFADAVDAELMRLMRLRFEIVNYPAFDPHARAWNRTGISRANMTLLERAPQRPPPDTLDCGRSLPVRLGAWSEHWLNTAGPMWVSPLPQKILHLDHRDNRGADGLAKRIATLLTLNWGAARRSKEIRMELRVLLRRLGELRRPSADPLLHVGRLADRVEEAVLRLAEQRIVRGWTTTETAATLRATGRRWFETWLDAEIIFERPAFLDAVDPLEWREVKVLPA